MKKIIEEVLQTEEQVKAILKQAREKATEIKLSAERDSIKKTNKAKEEAQIIIQTLVEEAKKQAEDVRNEKLKKSDRQADTLLDDRKEIVDNLVDTICDLVATTAEQKDTRS